MHLVHELIEGYTGLLIFEVAGKNYCLNNAVVAALLKPPYRIYRDKHFGVDNPVIRVNNKSIPLIYLKNILGSESGYESPGKNTRVIIVEKQDKQVALLVDRITEFIALDSKYITDCIKLTSKTELPEENIGLEYLEGSLEIENRCILMLNIASVMEDVHLKFIN